MVDSASQVMNPFQGAKATAYYTSWFQRIKSWGLEEAIAITRFEALHWSRLLTTAKEYAIECDISEVESVDAYYDKGQFDLGFAAAQAMSSHLPEWKFEILRSKEAQDCLQLSAKSVGAIVFSAGQFSAYKFVTQLVEILVNRGLNLQTDTPVTRVKPQASHNGWVLETTRGEIVASQVVFATNGYIQNLLPMLKEIKPTRDSMTVQRPPRSLSRPKFCKSYIFYYKTDFDYLIAQDYGHVRKLLFGGGLCKDPASTTYNDAEVAEPSKRHLEKQLPNVLEWKGEDEPDKRIEWCWSGIMGFSDDNNPWVGPVSETLGGGPGQWVCAGYTGNGTPQSVMLNSGLSNALLCAEALSNMILGKQPPDYFPRSYLISHERKSDGTVRASI